MLIDEAIIKIASGHGGRGAVSFRKTKMALGPDGGNGGKGGDIIFKGIENINGLDKFRSKKEFKALDGFPGASDFVDGANAKNLILLIPTGTVIHNLTNRNDYEMEKIGQEITIARGGNGGKGNFKFRSSTNTSPKEFQPGLDGEEFNIKLELKLIADVGFVGLPNVGKSTLLNTLTNAKAKTANYPFTTLEPNLGAYYELILADIPGIIEGASDGKGLGYKFLRHIERTKTIFHFLSAESDDIAKDYKVIKKELELYNPELIKKPEYLLLTKTDTVDEKTLKTLLTQTKKINKNAFPISVYDEKSLEPLKKVLNKLAEDKKV